MMDDVQVITLGGAWPERSCAVAVAFPHSYGLYWFEYVPVGKKVSVAVKAGVEAFALKFGVDAEAAWMLSIPVGAEEFMDVHGVTLVCAEWLRPGYVAIGRGGMQIINPAFREWRKVA